MHGIGFFCLCKQGITFLMVMSTGRFGMFLDWRQFYPAYRSVKSVHCGDT